jgi:flagellar M-ring protein FliF
VKDQLTKVQSTWNNLSFNQKIVLGTLAIASVFIIGFFYTHSQEDYDVMLSNLEEADAAAVIHNLKEQGVPYKLSEGGTTVLVPRSKKEELRLGVFQDDLIKSDKTVGYGELKSLPFGMTDWQEKKYDQKIISDEVVNTLEKINGIKKARVILAQGQDSLFSSEKQEPTASVMLIVEPGLRLKPEQVKTVKALVAHSVPGLKPENVALSDSMGNELSDEITSAQGATGNSEGDNLRTTYEKQKAKDILEMLTAVVGPNNAVVKVSAVMNFDRTESKIKRFIPTGGTDENPVGIPVSVQQHIETYDGKGKAKKAEEGQPGVASNVPTYSTDEVKEDEGEAGSKYQDQHNVTNYEISSEEKTIVHAPGTVEKMSIAVVVNKVLTESQTKELTQLVSSASGLDAARGDTVTVSGLQFSPELQEQNRQSLDILKQSNQQELIVSLAQLAGIFILGLAALFIFYKLIHRPVQGEIMEEEEYAALPEDTEPLLGASAIPVLEAKLDPEIEQMRDALNNMVNKDPTEAARVLVTYMKDM